MITMAITTLHVFHSIYTRCFENVTACSPGLSGSQLYYSADTIRIHKKNQTYKVGETNFVSSKERQGVFLGQTQHAR